jgi:hypothetical protein
MHCAENDVKQIKQDHGKIGMEVSAQSIGFWGLD